MVHRKTKYLLFLLAIQCASCKHAPGVPPLAYTGYPPNIEAIIINNCATAGCHDDGGYVNVAGLNLSSWEKLFNGSRTGSTVIPYRPDFSSFCYATNIDTALGIVLLPTMPYNRPPLSKEQYISLRDWIADGAPDANGKIKFADDHLRDKIYITNRMCDVVTVLDAASLLQMRYVDVGNQGSARYPYCIKVSPDRRYWYVSFFAQTNIIQKFSADGDNLVGQIDLGNGAWTSFQISGDSKCAWFVDNSTEAKIAYVDLDKMMVLATYTFNGQFQHLTGIAVNEKLKKVYVGTTGGNRIYSIDISDPLKPLIHEIPMDIAPYQTVFDWVELLADTNTNRCYIAPTHSNQIKILDMQNDTLLSTIALAAPAAFMAISHFANKLFITSPDDSLSFPGNRGAVSIVDLATNAVYKKINTGYQPYGITVDDRRKIVAVVNANISSGGPASHHQSGCGKKNGNATFIDLNTLELVHGKSLELAAYPFGAASR